MSVSVGAEAPDFEATTQSGERFRLADLRGKKHVVLYFYPRDFTTVCTAQACLMRDAVHELASQDVEVVGVSTDPPDKHSRFARTYGLPFTLVADESGEVGKRFGALGGLRGLLGFSKRITYVIDKRGIVRARFQHELSATAHLRDIRAAVESLR